MPSLVRTLAILLLAGTVLLGIGAAVHPVLGADAGTQLRLISATDHWRSIHLLMLAGSALVVAGVWVRLITDGSPSALFSLPGLALISLGVSINALNIAFMAGAGWQMADQFATGRSEVLAIYEMTHPIGLVAARFGNLIVAIGALALGWSEWRDPARPRWMAWLAWVAAAGGLIGVLFFDEASRFALAAVALLSGWQLATGMRALTWGTHAPDGTRYI